MNKKYILTIDQGTTSTRSIIFDQNGKIVGLSQMEFSQICRKSGWVEHNPEEIFETVVQTMVGSLKNANLSWEDIKTCSKFARSLNAETYSSFGSSKPPFLF